VDINVGMDGLFVWKTTSEHVNVLPDSQFSVHMIHTNNVSPKKTESSWWHPYPVTDIEHLMNEDWNIYSNGNFCKSEIKLENESKVKCNGSSV
jgi:hypothetical protein